MAFRELSMVDVREVLRRWQMGQSARQIARDGVADRKTASGYINEAVAQGLSASSELTDEVIAQVLRAVQGREAPHQPRCGKRSSPNADKSRRGSSATIRCD